jgi:hypothetical protein
MSKNSDLLNMELFGLGYENTNLVYKRGKGWSADLNGENTFLATSFKDALEVVKNLPPAPKEPQEPPMLSDGGHATPETAPDKFDEFGNPLTSGF